MIIDAKEGARGVLVDEATSRRIPFARWANLATGEYEALAATPDGKRILQPAQVVRGRTRLRWIPAAPRYPATGNPATGKPVTPDDGRPERRGRRLVVMAGQECDARGCHRLAEWATADEQELEPSVTADGRRCERAETVAVHRWCSWHYRNPVRTSRRGVDSEVPVTVRPQ